MRVATWNVNNVVKRLDLLIDWLARTQPDVVALQELKCATADFPKAAIEAAGYRALVVGQRTWNGVALLARGREPVVSRTSLPGDAKDKDARYVEAAIDGVLFGCLYLPNGNPWPGPKFEAKLRWFERLRAHAAALWATGQPVVLLGDWNVVPTDADIYKPDTWRDNALLQPEPRQAFAAVLRQGWTDALARAHPERPPFTFWDYRRQRWPRDAGLRIDHILLSASLDVVQAGVDRELRGAENASDHAPVWAEIRSRDDRPSSDLTEAPVARLPATLAPQLATLAATVPPGDWIVETKFDGYRLLARVDRQGVRLFTRHGHDWTTKLQPVADAVRALGWKSAWLDGEIVVMNDRGIPDFNRLQNAIDGARAGDIQYFAFDLPYLDGHDLRPLPLSTRRALLQARLEGATGDVVRLSQDFHVPPAQMLEAARRLGLEGVMAKRADAPYVSGRGETWLKLKCRQRQEFVVVGFTERSGGRHDVGSLLLGYHEAGALRFAGGVGTGWGAAMGRRLFERLQPLQVDRPAVRPEDAAPGRWSKRAAGSERWVRPELVVEVDFGDWTPEGRIRHAVFRGVREDKPAPEVVREAAQPSIVAPAIKVSHGERVVDPTTGLRKLDLVRYYEGIADWLLPHLKDRPVSLVRAPAGISGELFFQKHLETRMPGVKELDPALWPGHAPLLGIDSAEALAAAAQMNVIEFHTWNTTTKAIARPDRVVFDLDPGEGVGWPMLQEAAVLTRTLLTELGLRSWLKTSGGKGLHVVVPLAPQFDDAVVKGFSQAVVRHMAKVIPQRFVAVAGGGNRVGRIFVDYLRNGRAQTTAAAFSARARPGLGVSMPIDWDELADIDGGAQWTIATARDHLLQRDDDPWAAFWTTRQRLAGAMKALGFSPKKA